MAQRDEMESVPGMCRCTANAISLPVVPTYARWALTVSSGTVAAPLDTVSSHPERYPKPLVPATRRPRRSSSAASRQAEPCHVGHYRLTTVVATNRGFGQSVERTNRRKTTDVTPKPPVAGDANSDEYRQHDAGVPPRVVHEGGRRRQSHSEHNVADESLYHQLVPTAYSGWAVVRRRGTRAQGEERTSLFTALHRWRSSLREHMCPRATRQSLSRTGRAQRPPS
jgi:hypothetical protein